MKIQFNDLLLIYDEEIKKNVKNKKKIFYFEINKTEYLNDIKRMLIEGKYGGGKYNIFLIFKPKVRVIMGQSVYDKIINHYVTKFILIPKLSKYLNNRNCATRKNMGTTYAINLLKKDINNFKKNNIFYFLKLDISKYFYNIDHEILLEMLKKDLTEAEYCLIKTIVSSTNKLYINRIIKKYETKLNISLPKYYYGKGLPIGNMTSQFLAIFYLAKLQHFIIANLHLKMINYMDDYVIIHENKKYLKDCLNIIKEKLNNEYKLKLNNSKTKITNCKEGVSFLGYKFFVKNKKLIIKLTNSTKKNIKNGIKRNKYLYENNYISFKQLFSSIETYQNSYIYISNKKIKDIIDNYWY